MSLPAWRPAVPVADLCCDDEGWRFDDPLLLEKLATSLRRHGQLRAVVVRHGENASLQVVDGRKLVAAMRALGWTHVVVADLGPMDRLTAMRLAIDLDLMFETDYAKLAMAVGELVESGVEPASLAAASPLSADRVAHLATLSRFDWSRFSEAPDGQVALDWGAEPPAEAPAPPQPAVQAPEQEPMDMAEAWEDMAAQEAPAPSAEPPAIEPDLLPEEPPAFEHDAMTAAMAAAIPPEPMRRPQPEAPEPEVGADRRRRPREPEEGMLF